MRPFISFLTIVLLVIGLVGVGIGTIAVGTAATEPGAAGILAALLYGSVPFLLGTVALGASAIVLSIEQATADQVAAINRGTEVAINEGRLAEHHRAARG